MIASGIWMLVAVTSWGIVTDDSASDIAAAVAALFGIAALVVSLVLAVTA